MPKSTKTITIQVINGNQVKLNEPSEPMTGAEFVNVAYALLSVIKHNQSHKEFTHFVNTLAKTLLAEVKANQSKTTH